jgi:hypothetical protein
MSISQLYPEEGPTLNLNFAGSRTLDPRITFTRTTSGTRTNERGLVEVVPANSPRFDHSYDPVSGSVRSLGLLVEEQRSNLVKLSNDFSSNFWAGYCGGKSNITYNTTDVISPDGSNNATKVVRGSNGCDGSLSWGVLWNSSTGGIIIDTTNTFTASIYARGAVGGEVINVGFNDSQMTNHTLTTSWQRISRIGIANTTDRGFQVKSDAINQTFYIWGAQLEQGAFPTSYIPTSGSTVTRTADNVSMVGENFSSWYNPSEGTFYVSSRFFADSGAGQLIFQIDNNNNANRNGISFRNELGSNQIRAFDVNYSASPAGFDFWTFTGSLANTEYKNAFALKSNDMAAVTNFPNGQETIVTSAARVLQEKTTLRLGSGISGINPLNGHIAQLTYYPRRLTNAQLQNLTK